MPRAYHGCDVQGARKAHTGGLPAGTEVTSDPYEATRHARRIAAQNRSQPVIITVEVAQPLTRLTRTLAAAEIELAL